MFMLPDVSRYRVKKVGDRYHVEEGRHWILIFVPIFTWDYCTSFANLEEAEADIYRRGAKKFEKEHPFVISEFGRYGERR